MDDQRVADYFVVAGLGEDAIPLKVTDETEATARGSLKEPITDLAVINRSAGESVPIGFTCLEETPGGHVADLNYGSFRCPQLFLCYRRGRDKPPLIHIGVHFDGRDRLMPQCELIRETPEGRCANVNNTNSHSTFVLFKRASSNSSPNDLVVTDVCVVIKDEKAPHTYWKINDRNLNNALLGADVFLCYKKATVNTSYLTYQPALLFRYPKNDYSSIPLPSYEQDIPLFSMPMGASLEAWPKGAQSPRPIFAKFVLTVSGDRSQVYSGGKSVQKLYGAVMSFYEPYDREKLKPEQLEKLQIHSRPEGSVFFASKAICILSRWPFFDAFQSFLQYLISMSFSKLLHSVSLERVISHFMLDVPFPSVHRPKVLLYLAGSNIPIALTRPDDSPIPFSGSSFSTMLKNLSAENCVNILLLTLLEQKICLHSLRPDVLTAVAECVTSMIFPFVWQCPYVPLCPVGLCGLLHAPVPFVIGVDSRYFDLYEPPLDVVYVDLDTNSIETPQNMQDLNLKLLPKKSTKIIMERLERITAKMLKEMNKSSMNKKTRPPEATPGEWEFKRRMLIRQFDAEIQEAFLFFMVSVLKGYRAYLKPMTRAPTEGATDPGSLFDLNGFLKSRDKSYLKFFAQFIRTQQFIRFIEERSIMSDREASYGMAFFDECVDRVEKEGFTEIRLIDADDILGDRTVFIPAPEPENPKDTFMYGSRFPALQYALFGDLQSELSDSTADLENADREAPKQPISLGDSVTNRTKQELKTSQTIAQHIHQRPKHWAKLLLTSGYALWFMCLPSLVASSNSPSRTLRSAFDTLKRMLAARIQPADKVCYRILMQLCGQHNQPALAVKVLSEMKNNKIQPDAVTYGYYNKVVFESHWSSKARSPHMLWMNVRHVVRGVTLFAQAGRQRLERNKNRPDAIDGAGIAIPALDIGLEDDQKRNTGGSSDTGFFSLGSEDKRNSMVSLTSGEFLASIAELKGSGKEEKLVGNHESIIETEPVENGSVIPQEPPVAIVRRSERSRISSVDAHGAVGDIYCCSSAGVLMLNQRLLDGVFENTDGPIDALKSTHVRRRRHKSLSDHARRKGFPRKRHLSTSALYFAQARRSRQPSSTPPSTPSVIDEIAVASLGTPVTSDRFQTPTPTSESGTVVILEETVRTVELETPDSDLSSEEEERRALGRRMQKSKSIPREASVSFESVPNLATSSSTDFAATVPKIGAFLRNTKSYSSIKKLWSPSDKKKSSKDSDSLLGDFLSVDSSPLAKSGAAILSGVKSVTSAFTKKLEELSTTMTTASSDSPSPGRGGSLRDFPGALNFADYTFLEDGADDEMDLYEDDGSPTDDVDASQRSVRHSWNFPTYASSPRHSYLLDGVSAGPTLIHVEMVSVVVCQRCFANIYDEEIMAGWWPDESNLNARCPYCATKFLPELSVIVFEHYEDDHNEARSNTSELPVCPSCPFLRIGKSASITEKLSASLAESLDDISNQPSIPQRTSVDIDPLLSSPADQIPKSQTLDPVAAEECLSQNSLFARLSCNTRNTLKVPYLSPLVLRKELETLLVNEGDGCLADQDLVRTHDIIYWNLLWYCDRLGLPQNLTGMLIEAKDVTLLTELGYAVSLASRSRFVTVVCRWDNPIINEELGTPMYAAFRQSGSRSSDLDALGLEGDHKSAVSKNLMVQMLMKIRDNSDLLTPMQTFLHEMQKRASSRHRGLYRELLFLAIRALDSENIDKIAFDKVYKLAFNQLRKDKDMIGILQADDRPPNATATWCRQAFRALEL